MPHILKSMSKRKLGLIIVTALAFTGVAIAYWTGSGAGTATGTASSGGTITLSGTVAPGIAPGLSRNVALTATNNTGSDVKVQTVSLVSVAFDGGHAGCSAADFLMPAVAEDQSIASTNLPVALAIPGVLAFANTAVNQDACKGATITLTLAST